MAIYHLSIKVIGRSRGRSAVSAAAYRAGERLCDYDTGTVHDYTHKVGVILSEIILPENAPESYLDRETLWNAVQKIEKNANAQLAREIEVALPNDIPRDWQIECVRKYINDCFVSAGMCADWALHDKGDGNPHAHILLTMRQFKPNGTWDVKKRNQYVLDENGEKIPVIDKKTGLQKVEKKTGRKVWERRTVEVNDWNDQGKAEEWRAAWADHINFYLRHEEQVDHRSFERQGIDKEPTIHEGYVARQMEQKGRIADRCHVNRDICERNRIRDWIREKLKEVTSTIIEKAKKQYNKLIGLFAREGDSYGRNTGFRNPVGDYGPTGRTDPDYRGSGERHRSIDGTDRFIEEATENISGFEQDAEKTDRRIDELRAILKEREENAYDEIRRIIERRNQKQSYGDIDDGIYSGGIEETAEGYRWFGEDQQFFEGTAGTSDIGKSDPVFGQPIITEKEYGTGDGFDEGLADELHTENERARKLLDDLRLAEQASGAVRDYHISQRHNRDNERKRQDLERKPETKPDRREPEKRSIEHKGRVR